jgi:hypothetical protein
VVENKSNPSHLLSDTIGLRSILKKNIVCVRAVKYAHSGLVLFKDLLKLQAVTEGDGIDCKEQGYKNIVNS